MFNFLTNNLRLSPRFPIDGTDVDEELVRIFRYCPKTEATEVGDNLQFKFATQDFDFNTIDFVYNTTNNHLTTPLGHYYKLQGFFVFSPSWYTEQPAS